MSGGSGSTHSLFCFAASIMVGQSHETLHSPGLRSRNSQNLGSFFERWKGRIDDGWTTHLVSTLAAGIRQGKYFDAQSRVPCPCFLLPLMNSKRGCPIAPRRSEAGRR